jgi:hypothetical protein
MVFQLASEFHALAKELPDLRVAGVGILVADAGDGDAAGIFE